MSAENEHTGDGGVETREETREGGAVATNGEPEVLFDRLMPKYLRARVFAALLDAAASESAARQRAMKAATDNANDLVDNLTRQSNQARQAQITREVSEIAAGANAMAG